MSSWASCKEVSKSEEIIIIHSITLLQLSLDYSLNPEHRFTRKVNEQMKLISKWNSKNEQKMRENILGRESIKDKFHSVYLGQMTTERAVRTPCLYKCCTIQRQKEDLGRNKAVAINLIG